MTDLDDIEREIDDLGIRDEVDQASAEYEALMEPTYLPGIGFVSTMAAQMLTDTDFSFRRLPTASYSASRTVGGECYRLGESYVHFMPNCRCPRRRR